jgi:hypothetical protein
LKNGLEHHRDVVPNFVGSQRARKIVRLAEAPVLKSQKAAITTVVAV